MARRAGTQPAATAATISSVYRRKSERIGLLHSVEHPRDTAPKPQRCEQSGGRANQRETQSLADINMANMQREGVA